MKKMNWCAIVLVLILLVGGWFICRMVVADLKPVKIQSAKLEVKDFGRITIWRGQIMAKPANIIGDNKTVVIFVKNPDDNLNFRFENVAVVLTEQGLPSYLRVEKMRTGDEIHFQMISSKGAPSVLPVSDAIGQEVWTNMPSDDLGLANPKPKK